MQALYVSSNRCHSYGGLSSATIRPDTTAFTSSTIHPDCQKIKYIREPKYSALEIVLDNHTKQKINRINN